MGALDDFYEVRQTFNHQGGQDALFVGTYQCTLTPTNPPNSTQLANQWITDVLPLITAIMHDSWTATLISVVDLNDSEDFFDGTVTDVGTLSGSGLPPVTAVGVRSKRMEVGVNRSRHQLPLGHAAWLGSDGSMTQAARDSCYFLVQQLGMEIVGPNATEYTPVVVRKTYEDHVLVDVELRGIALGQWFINRYFTTQKSRQDYLWQVPVEPE